MSGRTHLVERAAELMAGLGGLAAPAPAPAPALAPAATLPSSATATTAPEMAREPEAAPSRASAEAARPEPVGLTLAAMEAAGLAVAGARRSRIAEEWRITAGHLLRTLRAARPHSLGAGNSVLANLIMVTSTKPNEGKSFCALNLAGSLTMGRMADVLLVDIDSKPGALTTALGLEGRPGLFDLVADPALVPDSLVIATAIPGLSVLPIGQLSAAGPAASDRSVTRPVAAVIERVARRFAQRVIVMDCAPCLATSDPSALAPMVSQIAMVVEAERTQRHDLETALELLRTCPSITLVLNKVRMATTHAFGDYHYYDA